MGSDGMRKIKGCGIGERAVIGRLKRLGGRVASFGEIVFCEREINGSDISSLPEEISGIVAVGTRTDAAAVELRSRGISAVFISQEDAESLVDGERAVIYPERDTLFIAPKIEIVDDFSTRIKAEISSESKGLERLLDCRELFSGKVLMRALIADQEMVGDDTVFVFYKNAAQACELQKLVVLLDISRFDNIERLRAHLKGMIRAAVYTKLVLAMSVRSIIEYERISRMIRGIINELRDEGSESPVGISCGIWVNNAKEVVCIEEYSRAAELVAIDSESLLSGVCEEERERVLDGYLRVIKERLPWRSRDVVLMGDKQMLEKSVQGIPSDDSELQRMYFLMDKKT